MDTQTFSQAEFDNLQRLIDGHIPDEYINDEQIKDADVLFFSHHGYLETEDISQSSNQSNAETQQDLFPVETVVKKEPVFNYTQPKYKDLNGKSVRVFECGICGREFNHQYTLMRHLPTHTDERKFHCHICGKAFRQMSTLSQHKAIHSSARPYTCQVCNKNFNRVSTLISHSKTHTGVKPHCCHICNKSFHQKGNLRNHIFTHTNERPYKCDVCGKGFNQMSNLMCHKMKAHQNIGDGVPKYQCKTCGEEYFKRINLRQHEQFKHGVVPVIEILPNRNLIQSSNLQNVLTEYSSAIVVEPIETEAMKLALKSGNTPFALLRPLSGIPVLVRVIPAGNKQMLVPASADDLKKYGRISVKAKTGDQNDDTKENIDSKGCIVQIKIPVVATVIQTSGNSNEALAVKVLSPDPKDDTIKSSTAQTNGEIPGTILTPNSSNTENYYMEGLMFDGFIGNMNDQRNVDAMEFTFEIPQDARDNLMLPFNGSENSIF
ncbi:hypothetical protein ABEB36_001114 [Hypothenemus hampei]|uniref:C2H2-type domain-containing protein n=1 Tax=Hypothenemus hampei TaxID=57062 RepID=A0ABD1FDH9_HYPHA